MDKLNFYEYYFEIASVVICIRSQNKMDTDLFSMFLLESSVCSDIVIDVTKIKDFTYLDVNKICTEETLTWFNTNDNQFMFEFMQHNDDSRIPISRTYVDRMFSKATIEINQTYALFNLDYILGPVCEVIFRNFLIANNIGMVMHAVAINYMNEGILFSAPSGTGKTTQGNLWLENKEQTSIINGDRPVVTIDKNGIVTVSGSAWSGSSRDYHKITVPVKAFVFLKQSLENNVYKLSKMETVNHFMPRVFTPYFDIALADKAFSIIDKIIMNSNAYFLECRPDVGAVNVLSVALGG